MRVIFFNTKLHCGDVSTTRSGAFSTVWAQTNGGLKREDHHSQVKCRAIKPTVSTLIEKLVIVYQSLSLLSVLRQDGVTEKVTLRPRSDLSTTTLLLGIWPQAQLASTPDVMCDPVQLKWPETNVFKSTRDLFSGPILGSKTALILHQLYQTLGSKIALNLRGKKSQLWK